ncbi:MAG: hypothetical protein NTY06_00415 [Candidatus Gottesmanbacteria bacterium]|nr:hypothetical protein [Candidatus Gottesmanbacteria bacterium]
MILEKPQKFFLSFAVLLVVAGWFYWFQWKPSEIRKNCFKEIYSEKTNLEWAKGKEWMYYRDRKWGWLFPYWGIGTDADIYRGCLIYNGLK